MKPRLHHQTKSLDDRLNMCVCELPVSSQLFLLNRENFKNRKVVQVFKGVDEGNIGSNWTIGLGMKGLLGTCCNQFGWRQGERVNLYLLLTFGQQFLSFIYNVRNIFFFYFLCLYKPGNFEIIIKKSSFVFTCCDMFNSPFVQRFGILELRNLVTKRIYMK